jgi:hypothetical protein
VLLDRASVRLGHRQHWADIVSHRLADGTIVELGLRVVDYDRNRGFIEDSDRNREALAEDHRDGGATCEAWFDVIRDIGGKSYMDCSRMIAEGGRYDK